MLIPTPSPGRPPATGSRTRRHPELTFATDPQTPAAPAAPEHGRDDDQAGKRRNRNDDDHLPSGLLLGPLGADGVGIIAGEARVKSDVRVAIMDDSDGPI